MPVTKGVKIAGKMELGPMVVVPQVIVPYGAAAQKEEDQENENDNDRVPTKKEIEEAIKNKKNRKSTTDWRNEILKRGGDPMVEMIVPVIETFWHEEQAPKQWNLGHITNIWKG